MLNICKKIADDINTCDSIAAGAQIALFTFMPLMGAVVLTAK